MHLWLWLHRKVLVIWRVHLIVRNFVGQWVKPTVLLGLAPCSFLLPLHVDLEGQLVTVLHDLTGLEEALAWPHLNVLHPVSLLLFDLKLEHFAQLRPRLSIVHFNL